MSTATATAEVTAPTTWPTCESMRPIDECHNPADFMVETHTHEPFPVCTRCWYADASAGPGMCRWSGLLETRDEHARIVSWLL